MAFFFADVNEFYRQVFDDIEGKEGFPTIPCYGEGFKMRCFGFDKFNNRLLASCMASDIVEARRTDPS